MEQTSDILLDGNPIGTARIKKTGLYYEFTCSCNLPKQGIYRLWTKREDQLMNLGICVPQGSGYGLTTRVPVSRLGEGTIAIEAHEKGFIPDTKSQTVIEEEPFRRLQDLDKAYLTDSGIRFKD